MFCIQSFEQQIAVYVETVLSRAPHTPPHPPPFFSLFFFRIYQRDTILSLVFVSVAGDILEHFGPVFTLLGAHLPCSWLSLRLWFYLIASQISSLDFVLFLFFIELDSLFSQPTLVWGALCAFSHGHQVPQMRFWVGIWSCMTSMMKLVSDLATD